MAGSVVAGSNGGMLHRRGANEAYFRIVVDCFLYNRFCDLGQGVGLPFFCLCRSFALICGCPPSSSTGAITSPTTSSAASTCRSASAPSPGARLLMAILCARICPSSASSIPPSSSRRTRRCLRGVLSCSVCHGGVYSIVKLDAAYTANAQTIAFSNDKENGKI